MKARTVLAVDDVDDSRFMLRKLLEMRGCRVAEARDGKEAVALAEEDCPDLILMDLNMPEMDGLAATERIRELKGRCEEVPIIAVTAYDTYGIREAAPEAGCDEYIIKPFDLDHLEQVFRDSLGYLA
jgi:CheY-like chemotaxis protein